MKKPAGLRRRLRRGLRRGLRRKKRSDVRVKTVLNHGIRGGGHYSDGFSISLTLMKK
jgi:hypothetical protein